MTGDPVYSDTNAREHTHSVCKRRKSNSKPDLANGRAVDTFNLQDKNPIQ